MNRISVVLFVLVANILHAQDLTSRISNGIIFKVKQTLDSSMSTLQNALDRGSISPFDSLGWLRSDTSKHTLDSIKSILFQRESAVTSVRDSVQQILQKPNSRINHGISEMYSKGDSLMQTLSRPAETVAGKIEQKQYAIQQKIDSIQLKLTEKIRNTEKVLQEKISVAHNGELEIPNDLPQPPVPGLAIPAGNKVIDLDVIETPVNVNLSSDIPVIGEAKIPDTTDGLDALTEKVKPHLPQIEKVDDISEEITKIDARLDEVQTYERDVQKMKENGLADAEKLPEEIEKRVENMDEIKALDAEAKKATEYQDIIQRYKDQKLLHEEIKRKAKQVATEKLNKFSPAVKDAQQQIAKVKKWAPAVQSFKDLARKRPNEMKGQPFRQRFIPGMTLQTYNKDKFTFDWAIQAGYRMTGRLTTGLGYTYRLSVDKDNRNWVAGEGISGYRFFTDFRLLKTFYAHGEFEFLTIDKLKQPVQIETYSTEVWGSYFGIGKRYNISRKVKGSIIGLYRVDYEGSVPGLSKVNMRIGFDLSLKKEKRKFPVSNY